MRPEQVKAVLVGASLAATLAIVAVVVVRARSRRGREAADTGSGVVGTIVKSALWAALQTVVQVGATRWAAKALHQDPDHSPMVAAGD